jgi:hypothetical protein
VTQTGLSPLYVEARRVLLDALATLSDHRSALVVCGAQAVYLRTGAAEIGVAPYTTDSDLAVDPDKLGPDPEIAALMETAGFSLWLNQGSPEPGMWITKAEVAGRSVVIPVDLIVPEELAGGGSRGARLEGHGKRAARRARGLEAALIDNDPMTIGALSPDDDRRFDVRVAGVAALLIAKAHKIQDRFSRGRVERIDDKDAADVYRLMVASSPTEIARTFEQLLGQSISGDVTRDAVSYLRVLFGGARTEGVEMAKRALALAVEPAQVEVLMVHFVSTLSESLASSGAVS